MAHSVQIFTTCLFLWGGGAFLLHLRKDCLYNFVFRFGIDPLQPWLVEACYTCVVVAVPLAIGAVCKIAFDFSLFEYLISQPYGFEHEIIGGVPRDGGQTGHLELTAQKMQLYTGIA